MNDLPLIAAPGGHINYQFFTFSNNTITVGNGNDTIYGTMHDINMAGNSGVITNTSYTSGNNTIIAGNGNDMIYGTMHDLKMTVENSSSNDSSNTFSFAGNTITAGNGNDTIYGYMHSLNLLTRNGGTTNNNTFNFYNPTNNLLESLLVGNSMAYNVYNTNGGVPTTTLLPGNVLSFVPGSANLSSPVASGTVTNFNQDLSTLFYPSNTPTFAELFNGQVNITKAGLYTFQTTSDDGSALYIDNQLVVNNYFYQPSTERTGSVYLTTGIHNIGVAYFQGGGGDYLNFSEIFGPNVPRNTITAGSGADTLYGNSQNLSLTSGSSTQQASSQVDHNTFTFGSNTLLTSDVDNSGATNQTFTSASSSINGVNGTLVSAATPTSPAIYSYTYAIKDTQIGNVGTLALSVVGGTSTTGQNVHAEMLNNSFTFGDNSLTAGTGNDLLVGAIGSLSLTAIGGTTSLVNAGNAIAEFQNDSFTFGANTLMAGSGNDILIGDIQTLNILFQGGTSTAGANAYGVSFGGDNFTFGTNILNAGSGNDILVGNIAMFTLSAMGGTSINSNVQGGTFATDIYTFGGNTLTAGNGTDTLYGSIETFTLSAAGGNISIGNTVNAQLDSNQFLFGANSLTAGNGNDLLVGDVGTLSIGAVGGTASGGVASGQISGNTFTFGNNTLAAGDGNDTLIGDIQTLSLSATGGSATSGDAHAEVNANKFTFGNNTLTAGNGNDTLVGAIDTWDITLTKSSTAAADFQNNTFTFGNNILQVGSGTDTMYGDVQTVNFSLINGTASGNTITSGNNTLIGGSGTDTMYGMSSDMGQFLSFLQAAPSNKLILGNDTLITGSGNDTLWGYGPNLSTLPAGQVTLGSNTFAFYLGAGQMGNDTAGDFNQANDNLTFHGVPQTFGTTPAAEVQNVNAMISSFTNNGGHVEVNFVNGGTLTFNNIAYAGQSSIAQLVSNVNQIHATLV